MALLIAAPESMTAAAADLANIGSVVNAAHMTAAAPTVAVIPAAADEVSSGIASVFSQHAQGYQALAKQVAAFQEQFVQHLTSSAGAYAGAEVANVAALRPLAAGTGAAAFSGTQLLNNIQSALIIATALATVPFYIAMISPFFLVIAGAIALAGLAYLAELILANL